MLRKKRADIIMAVMDYEEGKPQAQAFEKLLHILDCSRCGSSSLVKIYACGGTLIVAFTGGPEEVLEAIGFKLDVLQRVRLKS